MIHNLPNPADRFRPRKHESTLSRASQLAWEQYQATQFPEAERQAVAATIAEFMAARCPADDLATLRRYGFTETSDSVSVRVHDGKDYANCFSINLHAAIEHPRNANSHYCGGPRWSKTPDRGIKPEARANMSADEWQELCDFQDKKEAGMLPESVEPFFAKLLEARQHYRDGYRKETAWPAEYKAEHGEYPTWRQIADRFHVLGLFLYAQWAPASVEVAA